MRNGHVLGLNSIATGALGALYWALASRWYGPASIGLSYSAISAMMLLAGIGQLNLTNVLVRFVPVAGVRTRGLVTRAYAGACATTLLITVGFLLLIPAISPKLAFLRHPLVGVGFAVGTAGYAVFVLQDGVLTGLRRPGWVLVENSVFGVVKVILAGGFALAGVATGILHSWFLGLVVALGFTNALLFTRVIPRAREPVSEVPHHSTPTPGYIVADYVGALCWLGATNLMPILVLARLGATQTAYFSIAWMIALMLFVLSANMGSSLIVEAVGHPMRVAGLVRRTLGHTALLMLGGVLVIEAFAPLILGIFGAGYARHGSDLLRLLALSALPNVVIATAVSASRAQRRMAVVVGVLATMCSLAVGLTMILVPLVGLVGAGIAWLSAQTLVAAGLMVVGRSLWLPSSTKKTAPATA